MILVTLAGCKRNEEIVRRENYAAALQVRSGSLTELLGERKFRLAYDKIYADRSKSRTAMEDLYNFTIVPHGAKVIEDRNKTSYTFKITREINSADYFENLVINVDSLGEASAFILEYTPNEPLKTSSHNSFTFKGDVKITPILYNVSEAGRDIVCVTAQVMMCNQAEDGGLGVEHVAGERCKTSAFMYTVTEITCSSTGGGGSFGAGAGQYTGGNNTGGQTGNGGGGDGNPPINSEPDPSSNCPRCPVFITSPVEQLDPEASLAPPTPCDHLKNLIKSDAVKNSFSTLDTRKEQSGEWGFGFKVHSPTSNSIMAPNVIEASHSDPNKLDMEKAIGGNYVGASHTHPHIRNGFYPMFSLEDIEYLLNVSRRHDKDGLPKDYSIYVLTLTTYDGVFAIKIKNPLKFYGNYSIWKDQIGRKIEAKYDALKPGGSMVDFRMAFLEIISEFDLGIGLFEATNNVTKWGELEISKGKPVLKPCE